MVAVGFDNDIARLRFSNAGFKGCRVDAGFNAGRKDCMVGASSDNDVARLRISNAGSEGSSLHVIKSHRPDVKHIS